MPGSDEMMTHAKWLACTDPPKMLQEVASVGVSYRKARLFCCAYCRRFFWNHLPPALQDAVEVAEGYADEAVSKYKLRKARAAFNSLDMLPNPAWRASHVAAWAISRIDPYRSACNLVEDPYTRPWRGGKKAIAALVREIFAFPYFDPALAITASALHWNDGTIPKLAQHIYDARAFDQMPILADALEEAGCTAMDVLSHCRTPAEHLRGCWAVDWILDKQ
jgi:hypothetical protein